MQQLCVLPSSQDLLSTLPLTELSDVAFRAQHMVDSRIRLWEHYDAWQKFLLRLGATNVLRSPVVQSEDVQREVRSLVEVVEQMEALHVNEDPRSVRVLFPTYSHTIPCNLVPFVPSYFIPSQYNPCRNPLHCVIQICSMKNR
jgi:hypothetical protein